MYCESHDTCYVHYSVLCNQVQLDMRPSQASSGYAVQRNSQKDKDCHV